ncbi:MAG: hypothetical protein PWP43_384 [Bacillota bacterium]|nr:hypothetical protein [Bacillota bacterium]
MDPDFSVLYRRYKNAIYGYLYYLSGDRGAAEDLCQDVFLKVYLNLTRFAGRSSFKTWLYRIAHNTYLDFARTRRETLPLDADVGGELPAPLPGPEEAALNAERRERIRAALQRLPADYRTLLVLRELQYLTYKEISQVTGQEPTSVKVGLYRARREFRRVYRALESE